MKANIKVFSTEDFIGCPRKAADLKSLAKQFEKSTIVTTKQLAEKFEISERRLLQLVDEGFLYKVGRNSFNLEECCFNYMLYQKRVILRDSFGIQL